MTEPNRRPTAHRQRSDDVVWLDRVSRGKSEVGLNGPIARLVRQSQSGQVERRQGRGRAALTDGHRTRPLITAKVSVPATGAALPPR